MCEYFYHLRDENSNVFASVLVREENDYFVRSMAIRGMNQQHDKKLVRNILTNRALRWKDLFCRPKFANKFSLPTELSKRIMYNAIQLNHSKELFDETNFCKINPRARLTEFERHIVEKTRKNNINP